MDAQLTSAPRPNRLALTTGLAVLLLLAACGSTSAPTGSPPATPLGGTASPNATLTPAATGTPAATATPALASIPDPCVLVTKDEASAAVGTALNDPSNDLFSRPDGTTGRTCYYTAPSGPGSLSFNIWRATPAQAALYKEEQKQFGDVHDIAGLGDAAYRVGWIELVVLKGDYLLEYGIEMADYDPDTAQANLKTLATTSISRL
jgi:Protein of unknown function (DUF3558)